MKVKIESWKKHDMGSTQGFLVINFPDLGMTVKDCKLIKGKDGQPFIALPQREYTDKEGQKKYTKIVGFFGAEHHAQFQKSAIEALKEYCAAQRGEAPAQAPQPAAPRYQQPAAQQQSGFDFDAPSYGPNANIPF